MRFLGDCGRGRDERCSRFERSIGSYHRIPLRTAATLPSDIASNLSREEFDHHLPIANRYDPEGHKQAVMKLLPAALNIAIKMLHCTY